MKREEMRGHGVQRWGAEGMEGRARGMWRVLSRCFAVDVASTWRSISSDTQHNYNAVGVSPSQHSRDVRKAIFALFRCVHGFAAVWYAFAFHGAIVW